MRRTLKDENIRKISRIGNKSLGVTLPVEMLKDLGWREKQMVKVTRIKGGVVIRDYRGK
jgi:antitoxin component of MazEF toxin-antitoxin module